MLARTESKGNFDGAQLALRGRNEIEQDLEALDRELRRQFLEAVAADHEEAAHGIGDLDLEGASGDLSCKLTGPCPLLVETVGAAALDIAAADHEFRLAAPQQLDHLRQLRFVMLQIGVDDSRIGAARGQNALDACTRQSAAPDPADTADAGILPRQPPHHFPGSVRGIVIDKDHFPGNAGQRGLQPPIQHGDVVTLVEGRHNDRKLRQTGLRRGFGARIDGVIHDRQRISAAARHAKASFKNEVTGR